MGQHNSKPYILINSDTFTNTNTNTKPKPITSTSSIHTTTTTTNPITTIKKKQRCVHCDADDHEYLSCGRRCTDLYLFFATFLCPHHQWISFHLWEQNPWNVFRTEWTTSYIPFIAQPFCITRNGKHLYIRLFRYLFMVVHITQIPYARRIQVLNSVKECVKKSRACHLLQQSPHFWNDRFWKIFQQQIQFLHLGQEIHPNNKEQFTYVVNNLLWPCTPVAFFHSQKKSKRERKIT